MIEVYINNELLELSDKQSVALTKQINDIGEISKRNADFTNRISVPKTSSNRTIFKMLDVPGNTSTLPYKYSEAKIFNDGIPIILKGIAMVTETTSTFEVVIYAGNYDLYSKIIDKTITDLDWSDLVHDFTQSNVVISRTNTDKYIYPIVETLDGRLSIESDDNIDLNYQIPFVFLSEIWSRIFSESGIEYYGDFFSSYEYLNEVYAADYDYTKLNKGPFDKFRGLTAYTPPYVDWVFTSPPISPVFQKIDIGTIEVDSTNFNISTDKYTAPEHGEYQITFKSSMAIQAIEYVTFSCYVNGVFRRRKKFPVNLAGFSYVNYSPEVTFSIKLREGDEVEFYYTLDNTDDTFAILVRVGWIRVTVAQTKRIPYLFNTEIDFSKNLPPIKQLDFLRAVMQKYGLVYQIRQDGRYEFAKMEDILNGEHGTINISEKHVGEISESYSISSNYSKINKFTYQYDENDKSGEEYADESFEIDNDNLNTEGVLIESIIQACGDRLLFDNWQNIASTNSYKNVATEDETSEEIQVPIFELNENKNLKCGYIVRRVIANQLNYTDGINPNYPLVGVNYPVLQFYQLQWQNLVEKYYKKYIEMAQTPVVKKVGIYYTPIDIYEIDFFKRLYFEKYQSYFYLNKVNSFLSGKITNTEIIKIQ